MSNSKNTILIRGSLAYEKYPNSFVHDIIPTIREWFTGQLVVSTWKGQEQHLRGLEGMIDDVVLSDDPGFGCIQSYDRQLISYKAGMERCSGDLVFVARADFCLKKNPFHLWEKVPARRGNDMKVFENRIVIGNMMTISPNKAEPKISNFRPSDWIQMGTKSDLLKWSGVLQKSHELHSAATGLTDLSTTEYKSEAYGSEQLWLISLLNKYVSEDITLTNYWSCDPYLVWCALINNFAVFNTRSTIGAYNLNWDFQPEFHPWYMTEQEYFQINEQLNGSR
jgi:hypothetical protein